MNTVSRDEIDEVFGRVEAWPMESRRVLADLILSTLTRESGPKPKGDLGNLAGLLKTDGPPPTDEEIAQMLHDERMGRYGS